MDEVIKEPFGGAHRNAVEAGETIQAAISKYMGELQKMSPSELKEQRYQRFRALGF
ncbi:MAG: hypothetical protein R2688_03235 [Fimbriimonadaceae bacterium]